MERRPDIGELPVDLLGAVGGELTSPRPGRLELDSKLLKDILAPVVTGSTTIPQVPLAPLGGNHIAYGYNLPTYGFGPTGAYTAPVVATSHPALHSYHHISSMGAASSSLLNTHIERSLIISHQPNPHPWQNVS